MSLSYSPEAQLKTLEPGNSISLSNIANNQPEQDPASASATLGSYEYGIDTWLDTTPFFEYVPFGTIDEEFPHVLPSGNSAVFSSTTGNVFPEEFALSHNHISAYVYLPPPTFHKMAESPIADFSRASSATLLSEPLSRSEKKRKFQEETTLPDGDKSEVLDESDPLSPRNLAIYEAKYLMFSRLMQVDPFEAEKAVVRHAAESLQQAHQSRLARNEPTCTFGPRDTETKTVTMVSNLAKKMRNLVHDRALKIVGTELQVGTVSEEAVRDRASSLLHNFEFLYSDGVSEKGGHNPFESEMLKELTLFVLYGTETSLGVIHYTRKGYTGMIPDQFLVSIATFLFIALNEYKSGKYSARGLLKSWSKTVRDIRLLMNSVFNADPGKRLDFDRFVREEWNVVGRESYEKKHGALEPEIASSRYKRRRLLSQ